jgi:N-acyl-D-aspartate/D-glutamate deacylase
MSAFDAVIRGGTIVDGSGAEPFFGDVAVKAGQIAEVGTVRGKGLQEIDASGAIVTPGFVDIHTHYDGQVTWEDRLKPSSDHGVTTVVMGNCGVGFAPVRPGDHTLVAEMMEGVEDIPEVVMTEGVPWNWESFPEYLDALASRRADIDFAAQIPHSPLRVYVMGQRGLDLEPPTSDDLTAMRRLTTQAVRAGAIGVSTSRALVHRFRDGRHAPSTKTSVDELLAIAGGLKDAGAGVFQLIPNFDNPMEDEFRVIERIQSESGRPISFTLPIGDMVKEGLAPIFAGLEKANLENRPIAGQFYPRALGILFGLDLSYHPFALNPTYKKFAHLSLPERVALMGTSEVRAKLLAEHAEDSNPFLVSLLQRTNLLFRLKDPPDYNPPYEESIKARAISLHIRERELMYDELLRDEGRAILFCPMANIEPGRLDAAADFIGRTGTVLGLGDGGAHYGMICDATYPTYFLAEFVRTRKTVGVATAIKMLAYETASCVGLRDRGLVKRGYKADLNIIELDRLSLRAPHVTYDLPAGGRRLNQLAEGYRTTMVSGVVTYQNGQASGALPGRLVRGGLADTLSIPSQL